MLKLLSTLLVLGSLAIVAGCGDGGGEDASSPLDEALRYLPANTPFAAAIDTDTKGDQYRSAGEIVDKFGIDVNVEEQIAEAIDAEPDEIKRLEKALGNEFVVGSTDVRAFVSQSSDEDQSFVGAIQATDAAALDSLVDGGAKKDGEANGATIYKDDDSDDPFAIEDDVLIVAGSRKELEDALATRDGDDSLTEEDFDAGTEGVPADALVRAYFNIEELLSVDDDAKQALKSKWVSALRTGGLAVSIEDDQVAIDFNVTTDSGELTDADLPIASGATAPEVLDRGDLNIGLRDPEQILEFAQATARAIDPGGFGTFAAGKQQIERRLGIDIEDDLFGQIRGGLAVSVDLDGKFGARAELDDPAKFERTLGKLADVIPGLVQGAAGQKVGFVEPKAGEDFYAVATAGGDNFVFGVVDGVFVLANDADVAGALAAEGTEGIPGAKGALVLSADAERLVRTVLGELMDTPIDIPGEIGDATAPAPFDELTGSLESSTEGLSGSFELTFD